MSLNDLNKIPVLSSRDILAKYDVDSKLSSYLDEVVSYNQKINIVSRETSRDGLIKIAAECLAPLELGIDIKGKIFDVGSGGGFPGIILLLAIPGTEGVLIERTGKKATFLEAMISKFGLNATVYNKDFGEVAPKLAKNLFDFGMMKYVKMEKKILNPAFQLLNRNGKYLYYSRMKPDEKYGIDDLKAVETCYYLDDTEQVRTINIISKLN